MTTEDARTILAMWVPGHPAPKGSLDVITTKHVRESNPRTMPWLKEMRDTALPLVAVASERPGRWDPKPGYPYDWPVMVEARFCFQRPAGPRFGVPATIHTGDVDKLTRCLLDALTYAGVYVDDSLVVSLAVSASYADAPGVAVRVVLWDEESAWHPELPVTQDHEHTVDLRGLA
jgi:hypothetical protein